MDMALKWSLINGSELGTLIQDLRPTLSTWLPAAENIPGNVTVGCAALYPTGVIKPFYNATCLRDKPAVCQYKSCLTIQGEPCIFPFRYKNVTVDGLETELMYTECSSQNLHRPWCPTSNPYASLSK